jgi:DNA-binding IclR family transcriptional regulator
MISLLELLAVAKNGLTLPELSRRLGFPKSSTHCLLVTLERRAYLRRNPKTHRYMLGVKLFALANVALGGIKLREQAPEAKSDTFDRCPSLRSIPRC